MRFTGFLAVCGLVAGCAQPPADTEAAPLSRSEGRPAELVEPNTRDVTCMAEAIYFEARGTGAEGTRAVGHVIQNRAESSKFPDTVCAVIDDKCQFSYRCDGMPEELSHDGARARALNTARLVLSGAPDITNGALFFHSAGIEPGWFNTRKRVGKFGGNIFYQ